MSYLTAEVRVAMSEDLRVPSPRGVIVTDRVTVRLVRQVDGWTREKTGAKLVVSFSGYVVNKNGRPGLRRCGADRTWDDVPYSFRGALLSELRARAAEVRADVDAFDAYLDAQPRTRFEPPAVTP